VRAVADEGRAVIFSSHLLDEVEQMSDYVFMINRGRLVLRGSLDDIKEQHHLLTVQFPSARDSPPPIDGILSADRRGNAWCVVCNGAGPSVHELLQAAGGEVLHSRNASLQEIFVARAGRRFATSREG
jgi:ABC-2 type transport system ATP-binding protein